MMWGSALGCRFPKASPIGPFWPPRVQPSVHCDPGTECLGDVLYLPPVRNRPGEGATEQPLSSWHLQNQPPKMKIGFRAAELSWDSDPGTVSSVKQMCLLKWEPRKKKVTGKLRTCYKTHLQKAIIITIVSPKHYLQTSFCIIPALRTALIQTIVLLLRVTF